MEDENPYQSPVEVGFVEPAFRAEPLPASAWRRLANLLLDQLACYLLAFVFGMAFVMIEMALGMNMEDDLLDKIPNLLFGIAVCLIYYVPQEALWGKSLAKFITGTRVVSADGTRPRFSQIFWRTVSRLIPFEPFSFLFGGNKPVGWHDKWSNTRVIMDR